MFYKLISQLFKHIKQRIFVLYIRYLKSFLTINNRPFVSGDNFKLISDYVVKNNKYVDVNKLNQNEIVFVDDESFDYFFNELILLNKVQFNLIIHNTSKQISSAKIEQLLDKNILIFAQNLNIDIEKYKNLFFLPTGFQNRNLIKNANIKNYFKHGNKSIEKFNKIFVSHNPIKNIERNKILKVIYKNELFVYHRYSGHKELIKSISKYKFVACPSGNKIDTVLIWESLFLNAIPILIKSNFTQNLKTLGLPILEINSWDELNELNEKKLNLIYKREIPKLNNNNYWQQSFWDDYINNKIKNFNF